MAIFSHLEYRYYLVDMEQYRSRSRWGYHGKQPDHVSSCGRISVQQKIPTDALSPVIIYCLLDTL